jgi:hypothetical protein
MTEIPHSLYYLIGTLVVANLATIGSVIFTALKAAWWLSKLDSRVDEARRVADLAHKRIDKREDRDELTMKGIP